MYIYIYYMYIYIICIYIYICICVSFYNLYISILCLISFNIQYTKYVATSRSPFKHWDARHFFSPLRARSASLESPGITHGFMMVVCDV